MSLRVAQQAQLTNNRSLAGTNSGRYGTNSGGFSQLEDDLRHELMSLRVVQQLQLTERGKFRLLSLRLILPGLVTLPVQTLSGRVNRLSDLVEETRGRMRLT